VIGVVVPCFRQEAYLPRTLAAIERGLEGREWRGVLVMSAPGSRAPAGLSERWQVIAPPVQRPLTPGAARMLGFAACGGSWVLFVDADVEVEADWLDRAIAFGEARPDVAGVWGRIEEWFVSGPIERRASSDLLRVGAGEREVAYVTAIALYRRDALLAAGGYDARLSSEEDFELGMRLRGVGAVLVSLDACAGRHWSAPRPSLGELARRWSSGLCFGQGQVLRLYVGQRGFLALLRRQALYVAVLALWALGVVALVATAAGRSPRPLVAWSLALLSVLAFMILRKRSVRLAVYSLLTWSLNGFGMLVGFVRGPHRDARAARGRAT
jgi:glycosyltransferase involved in cell wall biosynthesis